jgi:hypothetical protein
LNRIHGVAKIQLAMVHVQSTYPINLKLFKNPSDEIPSYWFGYLRSRAYMFSNRHRIRCRAPLSDMGHLYQLAKDIGTFKSPRSVQSERGGYAQFIIDSKEFCEMMISFGWYRQPSEQLDWRHVARGVVDGRGSISRNGRGKQAKYLRLAFYLKDVPLLEWLVEKLGKKVLVGSRAVEIVRMLYFNQSRYLDRKFEALRPFIL